MQIPDHETAVDFMEYIIDELSDFYEPTDARLWLHSPQKLLGGARPAELIQAGDTQRVIEIINQLRDDVYR